MTKEKELCNRCNEPATDPPVIFSDPQHPTCVGVRSYSGPVCDVCRAELTKTGYFKIDK